MCDENGCCQACQDRANELGVHPGSAGPDKQGDTDNAQVYLSTGQPKFQAPAGLREPGDGDKRPTDQRKADYVQRQSNVAAYSQFG